MLPIGGQTSSSYQSCNIYQGKLWKIGKKPRGYGVHEKQSWMLDQDNGTDDVPKMIIFQQYSNTFVHSHIILKWNLWILLKSWIHICLLR